MNVEILLSDGNVNCTLENDEEKEREKVIKIFIYILFLPAILSAEISAVWVPAWDMQMGNT